MPRSSTLLQPANSGPSGFAHSRNLYWVGICAAVFTILDVLFGGAAAVASTAVTALTVIGIWYVLPLTHGHRAAAREEE